VAFTALIDALDLNRTDVKFPNLATLGLFGVCILFASCGGSGDSESSNSTNAISVPTTINLIPANQNGAQRLFVSVSKVGALQTSLPLLFDTGSGGVSIDATQVFPSNVVSSNGFLFPEGATSITSNGITVTNVALDVTFANTIQHGNIGSAQITFGDASGYVTTSTMPLFFYYAVADRVGNPLPMPPQKGIFGVNGIAAEARGNLASPIKYLQFKNLNTGFVLSPVGSYPVCDITQGTCNPQPLLTVGLDAARETGFTSFNMICGTQNVTGPTGSYTINPGINGCSSVLPATVSVGGVALNSDPAPIVLFDTGSPGYTLSTSLTLSAPSNGTVLQVSLPTASPTVPFIYSWNVGSGVDANTSLAAGPAIVGSNFFLNHAYLIDFSRSIIGVQ